MAAGMLLSGWVGPLTVSTTPQADQAVATNFERFDGLDVPADHPATSRPESGRGMGARYGWDKAGASPRPGQSDQPNGQVYTEGPLRGLTNVLGGQPLPVATWRPDGDAITRRYTPSKTPSVQWRLGNGQANTGVAQTVALSEITNNPPVPGDLSSIIAGYG